MQITISVSFHLTFKLAPLSTDYSVGVSVVALPQSVINALLHVSVAGSPAVDSASDSGLDRLPPAPRRSAQCSAARGGLARMRSHPGSKQGFNGCLQTKKKNIQAGCFLRNINALLGKLIPLLQTGSITDVESLSYPVSKRHT